MTWTEDHYQLQHVMVFHFLQRSFARPRRCFWHLNNLRPFWHSIHYYYEYWSEERSREINMNPLPRLRRPVQWNKWSSWWHIAILLTTFTLFAEDLRSLSIPGHHTKLHPNDFIITTPKYPSWIWSRTWEHSLVGITTSIPHIKHHWDTVSSSRLAW